MQPADTDTQGPPDHLGVLTHPLLMPAPAPVLGDRWRGGPCAGIRHMRQASSQCCGEQRTETAHRFLAGLMFMLRCRRVPECLPGPLPVCAPFLTREGTAVVGIGKHVLHP